MEGLCSALWPVFKNCEHVGWVACDVTLSRLARMVLMGCESGLCVVVLMVVCQLLMVQHELVVDAAAAGAELLRAQLL